MHHNLAQHLAQQGRYGDDTLVHVNRRELAGLQQLAQSRGHTLSTNPRTGLPEAFSLGDTLKSFAPTLAGAGLSMIPGVGPFMAAALVGGGYGLATGSMEKGLMAGLGAYGGAGIGGALADAGTGAAAKAGLETSLPAAGSERAAMDAVSGATNPMMGASTVSGNASNMLAGAKTLGAPQGWSNLAQQAGGTKDLLKYGAAAAAPTLTAASQEQTDVTKEDPAYYQQYGFHRTPNANTGTNGERQYFTDTYTPYGRSQQFNYGLAGGGIAALGAGGDTDTAVDQFTGDEKGYKKGGETYTMLDYKYDPSTGAYSGGAPQGIAGLAGLAGLAGTGSPGGFDSAGYLAANPDVAKGWKGTPYEHYLMYGQKEGRLGGTPAAAPTTAAAPAAPPARTGITAINSNPYYTMTGQSGDAFKYLIGERDTSTPGMAEGGAMMQGPGDGTSDSIPASVEGTPAKMADGEFVIPARVVAEIGNGSSNAGAKRLYAMMSRIEAHMKGSQRGEDSGAWRELPA